MNNYNWKNSFPEPTQNFHEKICYTLDNLTEREQRTMKRFTLKKCLVTAAAIAILAVGSAVIATQGTTRIISGNSLSIPTYKKIPESETVKKDIGINPKILPEFSNGYAFSDATAVNNAIEDIVDGERRIVVADNGMEEKFKSLSLRYKNGEHEITLNTEPSEYGAEINEDEAENYNSVSIGYNSFSNKFVPGDYIKTEQDLIDEEDGKYIFSYGTDDIEIHEVQGVTWIDDGIRYHINAMDSPLGKTELINMAKEIIDFSK